MKKSMIKGILALGILTLFAGFLVVTTELPAQSNTWFSSSGTCNLCHSTSEFALRDSKGTDVSPTDRWRSTMLANASKDPFWKAKVRHEGLENPSHKEALENVCTRCHAPMGMINAFLNSTGNYTLEKLSNDDIGKDGVSCTVCHQISDFNSSLFSGHFTINTQKEIYGPYENPIVLQMQQSTGYTPVFSERINDSRLCGSCHTLFTNSVDEFGNPTGKTFTEQALYHEWENSVYGKDNISCQSCHIPRIHEPVRISSRPGFINPREPFGIHNFTGGNVFMLQLLRENHDELELHSGTDQLSASISRTKDLLTGATIHLNITNIAHENDSIFVTVNLKNLAGHKFPTGFPSRRAYLECLLKRGSDTVWHSGKPGSAALTNTNLDYFEPHHQKINKESQVQIYEFVMGDIRGKVTTVLEKAYTPLKDNRILPLGFQRSHSNYDTVKVVGNAGFDPDYSADNGTESLIYAIPVAKTGSFAEVEISLYYETAPENWLHELFEYSEADQAIKRFKTMYSNSDRSPVRVAYASEHIIVSSSSEFKKDPFLIYPNPSDGRIFISGISEPSSYTIYTSTGNPVVKGITDCCGAGLKLNLPPGFYLFVVESGKVRHSGNFIIR